MSDREEVDGLTVKCDGLRKLVDRLFNRWRWFKEETEIQLSTLRAENERLRERCEAATFVRYGNVSFQKSLMSGKWIVFRDHHEVTEYLAGDGRESFGNAYADTIDAGWLRDSNNKGGGVS